MLNGCQPLCPVAQALILEASADPEKPVIREYVFRRHDQPLSSEGLGPHAAHDAILGMPQSRTAGIWKLAQDRPEEGRLVG